jgi:HTH-type transcriptional regulator/antitoxin HigA
MSRPDPEPSGRQEGPIMATATTLNDRDPYFELIRRLPLRPIRSDDELDRAIAVVDELVTRDDLSPGERDYLDVLSDLIHKYETAEHPIPPATDAEVLRFLMDSRGLTQSQLAAEVEIPVSVVSEVLSSKRGLSRNNIGILARHFNVSPAVFF